MTDRKERSYEAELIAKAADRSLLVGVVGLGYVGLPLAVEFAKAGYRVLGYDVRADVVEGVGSGRSHIRDVRSEALAPLVKGGGLSATSESSRLAEAGVISICVPTPLSKTRDPDVSYVLSATEAVKAVLRPGQAVILESTTYPGTTRELMLPALESTGLRVGREFFLAFSPERVDPGNERWHTRNTPKVVGGITEACLRVVMAVYAPVIETLVPVSSTEAAELVKVLENTFRSVNIGMVNEMAIVCDKLGVDVWEVIEAAATKPFGYMKFLPGPGIGGHCIPVDPHYLAWKMRTLNYRTRFIDIAGEVNSEMPVFWVRQVQDKLNEAGRAVKGSRILVVGVAYKRDIGDVRESPAFDIMRLLESHGATVSYHDPYVTRVVEDDGARESVALTADRVREADCVVIVTDHSTVDYELIAGCARNVVDTRDALRRRVRERA